MVELLHPPIELVDRLPWTPRSAAILVDCGAGTSNHLLTRAGISPVAVIDHHLNESRFGGEGIRFRDVRVRVSASASIAASYLREQHIEPGEKLATAMLYAFRAETSGCAFRFTKLDRWAHLWLTRRANPSLLAEIENAPLTRSYYGDLILALQNTFVYDDVALCFLPRAHGAEIVGEVADLLIRDRSIRRVLCAAPVGADLLMSARTEGDCDSATELLTRTIDGLGTAGGHQNRAGGKIAAVARAGRISESLEDDLRTRWLEACQVERQRGTRLIARRLIVGNL